MVAKYIVLTCAFLIGCTSGQAPTPCGQTKKMISWENPHLDGEYKTTVVTSSDGSNWVIAFESPYESLHAGGLPIEYDSCKPFYWSVEFKDNFGHWSREAGCLGNNCRPIIAPKHGGN